MDENSIFYRAFELDQLDERYNELKFAVLYGIESPATYVRVETEPMDCDEDEEGVYISDLQKNMNSYYEVKCELFIIRDIIETFFAKKYKQ